MNSKTKFVVLAKQRTGSTMFMDLLSRNPEIRIFNEVFLNRPIAEEKKVWGGLLPKQRFYEFKKENNLFRPIAAIKYLNSLENEGLKEHNIYGFKLMYGHLRLQKEILFQLWIKKYKVIHLYRENYFDNYLSQRFNRLFKVRHAVGDVKKNIKSKIYLEPNSIVKKLNHMKRRTAFYRKILSILNLDVLEIRYEDLALNKTKIMNKVETFLDIKVGSIEYETDFNKVDKRNYKDKIENYSEIKERLSGTEFQID